MILMTFKELAVFISKIEKTSSRLEITRILADLFKKLDPTEFQQAAYLLQGAITPRYLTINFGMAEKMVIRAIAAALQVKQDEFTTRFKKIGDIGTVIEEYKKTQPSLTEKNLTVKQVFDRLTEIAKVGGEGSQDKKIQWLATLVNEVDPLSGRYLVRIPLGVLRLGFSDMTILDALSWMMTGDKSLRPALQKAYHVRPDLGYIGKILKQKGLKEVAKIEPVIFTPIIMMRAERLSSGAEIIKQIGKCMVEPKYDGFRLQVHKKGKEVRLYTRSLEDTTFMYPDIVEGVRKEVKADEAILEGEAIGYDIQTGSFLPFQETVQRKRKYGIEEKAKEIPLKLFTFELLLYNGESFIDKLFTERRKKLNQIISPDNKIADATVFLANDEIVEDPKRIELIFDDAITKGLEGIIAKKLDGIYQPGARGWNWIKFKRSYSSKIEDTIDCLVMGYDYGKGKRAGFGIGAFLVGVYDEKADRFLTVAKIGTGLKDDEWRQLKVKSEKFRLRPKAYEPVAQKADQPMAEKVAKLGYDVDKLMECDVWISPKIVVEIKADEITRSPVHTAGRKLKTSKSGNAKEVDVAGYALRFPRLVRFREDKTQEETTTLKELHKMFNSQRQ